jgi:predicted TIM-barrel fold metal-dependent hydrolase
MKPKLAQLPSFYFRRQCYAAIMQDDVGLKLAKEYGLTDNMLWSCDYPHGESVFGNSRGEIKKIFDVLGPENATKVVGTNAARIWNL